MFVFTNHDIVHAIIQHSILRCFNKEKFCGIGLDEVELCPCGAHWLGDLKKMSSATKSCVARRPLHGKGIRLDGDVSSNAIKKKLDETSYKDVMTTNVPTQCNPTIVPNLGTTA